MYVVRHCYIAVAHHIHGAPLMSISAIALFLVVLVPYRPGADKGLIGESDF